MEEKYEHAGRDPRPLVPPGRHVGMAGCHWVAHVDCDGRSLGSLEVYQWQPFAKKWCRPNEHASDRNLDLVNYRWVAPCPLPVTAPEFNEVKATLTKIKNGEKVSPEQMEQLMLIFHEQVFPYA